MLLNEGSISGQDVIVIIFHTDGKGPDFKSSAQLCIAMSQLIPGASCNIPSLQQEATVDNLPVANILNKSFWTSGNGSVTPEPATVMANSQYVVAYEGIVAGSLGIGSTKKHSYAVYGRSAPPNRGEAIVQVGYLVAFK